MLTCLGYTQCSKGGNDTLQTKRFDTMKMITKKIAREIPMLYETDGVPEDETRVVVKFFDAMGSWSWYAAEAAAIVDGELVELNGDNYETADDIRFFGYVDGLTGELGYFHLSQIMKARMPERDRWLQDGFTIQDAMNQ